MSGKYFIFSIRRPASAFCALVAAAQLLLLSSFLVSPSTGIPVAVQAETSTSIPSTTVKILIPPSSSDDAEDDDDAVIIDGNGTYTPPREPFHPGDCFQEMVKGPCRAIIDMWFFNTQSRKCEMFQYSGCGGNGNRFSDEEECNNYCGEKNNTKDASDDDDDTVIIEPGMDNSNGTCPKFEGCGPLKCAVLTDEETGCKKCACATLPEDSEGKPSGSVSGKPSEEDDERTKSDKPEDVCGLPEVRGDCRAMVTRYRYDSKTKKCIMFHFGGCNSNGNNFVSEEKCTQFCKGQ